MVESVNSLMTQCEARKLGGGKKTGQNGTFKAEHARAREGGLRKHSIPESNSQRPWDKLKFMHQGAQGTGPGKYILHIFTRCS